MCVYIYKFYKRNQQIADTMIGSIECKVIMNVNMISNGLNICLLYCQIRDIINKYNHIQVIK